MAKQKKRGGICVLFLDLEFRTRRFRVGFAEGSQLGTLPVRYLGDSGYPGLSNDVYVVQRILVREKF